MGRKSAKERRQEREEAHRRAWEEFYPRLQSVTSVHEAFALAASTVAPGAPGRAFFSNLIFFLQNLVLPAGAGPAELGQYRRLASIFFEEGALSAEIKSRIHAEVDARKEF